MFGYIICLKFKNIRYVQRQNRMLKSIENEEIIIAMTKTIITKMMTIMTMRIKIGNRMKI